MTRRLRLATLTLLALMAVVPTRAHAVLILSVGNSTGSGGDLVDVALAAHLADSLADPSQLAGVDITLHWDPTLVTLEGVSLPATSAWQFAANTTVSGQAIVSMATLDPTPPTPAGVELLHLRFRIQENVVGSADLVLSETTAFDLEQNPLPHLTVNGAIIVGAVTQQVRSFGAAKARFHQR